MLRVFELVNNDYEEKEPRAVLRYDEDTERYQISIPKETPVMHLPAILSLLAQTGRYELDDEWSRKFVKERVVPFERQNIGEIMREVGMVKYDEFPLLVYTSGRCCMDDFYLKEITGQCEKQK